ncbi:unnamed protein product [Ectocarpus sp. 12 AP-2014]
MPSLYPHQRTISNSNEWVSPRDQKEAMDLSGLHLAHCHALLHNIKYSTSTAIFWPEVETNEALQATTARFTAKSILEGEVISKKKQQQQQQPQNKKQGQLASPYSSSPSRRDRTNKSFRTSLCSPHHEGGTASSSDDATHTLPPSTSTLSSSPSSFLSASSAHTFTGSENITVRSSSFSRWGQSESGTKEATTTTTTPVSTPPSTSTPPSPSPSGREAPPCMGRQKKNAPAKVPVSRGVAFLPYRSPTIRENPRGSSLRGSGAIAGHKTRFRRG